MRYLSVNRLSDFEFHDSEWMLASYDDHSLILEVTSLNIHKDSEQNLMDCDMEINCARMTFEGWNIVSYMPGVLWKTDDSGNSYPAEPMRTYSGEEALHLLLHELRQKITVFSFGQQSDGNWAISAGSSDEPYFEAAFCFDAVRVEWDAFRRPAWYVLRERGIQA